MPFYLSLATFLMSLSFFAYGMFKQDAFIYVSNLNPFVYVAFFSLYVAVFVPPAKVEVWSEYIQPFPDPTCEITVGMLLLCCSFYFPRKGRSMVCVHPTLSRPHL